MDSSVEGGRKLQVAVNQVTAAEDDEKVNQSTELQPQGALERRGISLDRCRLID